MLLHMDGFDSYAVVADLAMEYTEVSAGFSTTGGRFGAGGVQLVNSNARVSKSLPAANTEVWTGVAFQLGVANSDRSLMMFLSTSGSGDGIEASVSLNSNTGVFTAYRGDGGTSLGTSAPQTIGVGTWHWLEVHYKLSNTVGIMEVWLDGNQIINVTGANTTQNGQSSFVAVMMGSFANNLGTCNIVFDDWYILDPNSGSHNTSRLGDSKVETLLPNSDASPNDGTPSTGSNHYACVNEAQWSSSEYLTITNTSGQEEIFGMTSLAETPVAIYGVRVLAVAEKTDSGSCNFETVVRSSSTSATGGSTALTTTYGHVVGIQETDPNTSSTWTASGVNAMNCGAQVP